MSRPLVMGLVNNNIQHWYSYSNLLSYPRLRHALGNCNRSGLPHIFRFNGAWTCISKAYDRDFDRASIHCFRVNTFGPTNKRGVLTYLERVGG